MLQKPGIDPKFTILCVRTNTKTNGGEPKNKYSIDVETAYGAFPVTVRNKTDKIHLTQPLSIHTAHKAIKKEVADLVSALEKEGKIGQIGQPPYELNKASPEAANRTEKTKEALRQHYAQYGAEEPDEG